jgi:hypothetical protein
MKCNLNNKRLCFGSRLGNIQDFLPTFVLDKQSGR